MKCPKCNSDQRDEAKFCDNCGASLVDQNQSPKKQSIIYNDRFLGLLCAIIIAVVIIVLVVSFLSNSSKKNNQDDYQPTVTFIETQAPTETETEISTSAPTEEPTTKEEFIESCEEVEIEDIWRNPRSYQNKPCKITGVVSGIDNTFSRNSVFIRPIDADKDLDPICAEIFVPKDEEQILKNDIITIWGSFTKMETYVTGSGNSKRLPTFDVPYYSISN